MARILFSALLASTMALSAHSSPLLPRTVATCNIDTEPFLTSYAVNACAAMNSTITLTGTTTIIVQPEPSFPYVAVFLTQENVNWSGSSAAAKTLCEQIVTECGGEDINPGTVGPGEMYGASVSTAGDFGGPGEISIAFYSPGE